jgi:hypothetical protein
MRLAETRNMPQRDPSSILSQLVIEGTFSPSTFELYRTLKTGRDIMVHTNVFISDDDAMEFASQANYIIAQLALADLEHNKKTAPKG